MFERFKTQLEDKTKEVVKEVVKEKTKSAVVEHLKKHKTSYILGGLGVLGALAAYKMGARPIRIINSPVFNNQPVFNNVQNSGYTHKIVKCLETGEIWESVKAAAEALGVSPSTMSKHLNGHKDHISGMSFIILGLSTA